jgi:hypothetical protein
VDFERAMNGCGLGDIDKAINCEDGSANFISDLISGYRGFVILRPLKNKNGSELLGRTIVSKPSCGASESLGMENEISLFGIPLSVDGLPFMTQDTAVAACATIALWITNNKLNKLFNTPKLSPYEITANAVNVIERLRSFPSEGLTVEQMLNFFKILKLDYDVVNISYLKSIQNMKISKGEYKYSEKIRDRASRTLKCIIPDTVRAFISAEIPVIAGLKMYKCDENGSLEKQIYHAVVLSGYEDDANGNVEKIYVHDDQIGPYNSVSCHDNNRSFLNWDCEWTLNREYNRVEVDLLIIPIYPKMRLIFNKIHDLLMEYREDPKFEYKLRLMNVQEFKREMCEYKFKERKLAAYGSANNKLHEVFYKKLDFLKESLPRFIWIIGVYDKNNMIWEERLFDATSHTIEKICEIDYNIII